MPRLILPGEEHRSASQRRIEALEQKADFYLRIALALVVREGGKVVIPQIALELDGALNCKLNDGAVTVTVAPPEGTLILEDDPAAEGAPT